MPLSDEVSLAIRSASPEIRQDPSLALTAAMTPGDTQGHAEVASHLLNQKAIGSAVDGYSEKKGGKGVVGATLGWLGGGVKGAMNFVGSGVAAVGHVANMPLEQLKQQYRYLRDVEARHGFGAMLLDAIPMAAGAAAGFAVAGPAGTFITAGLMGTGAAVLGKAQEEGLFGPTHKDSWERTASADYVDPNGGQSVSIGRDAARGLNFLSSRLGIHIEQHKGFDLYDAVSGLGDGLFSVIADPLSGIGATHKAMKLGQTAERGILASRLATKWGGVAANADNLVALAAESVPTRRAMEHLATLDAGTIGARYKKLRPFARELGEAKTFEEVGEVFKNSLQAAHFTQRALPRRTLANATFGDMYRNQIAKLSDLRFTGLQEVAEEGRTVLRAGEEAGVVKGAFDFGKRAIGKKAHAFTSYIPASFDEVASEMQKKVLHFNDPGSAGTIYDLAKWGHSEGMARKVAEAWAMGNVQQKQIIYRNVVTDNIANLMELTEAGWAQSADGAEVLGRIGDEIDGIFGGIDGGRTTPWGFDKEGRTISRTFQNGQTVSLPVFLNQVQAVPMPNYMVWRKDMIGLRNSQAGRYATGIDDFLFTHFTQNIFRRWALASGGFAFRAAAQDLIPYLAKNPKLVARGAVVRSLAKRGWSVDPEEEQHIVASMMGLFGRKLDITEEHVANVAEMLTVTKGYNASPGVRAGYNGGIDHLGAEQFVRDQLRVLNGEVPRVHQAISEQETWAAGRKGFYQQWYTQAKNMAETAEGQAAAAELRQALSEGVSEAEATHRATLKVKNVLDRTPEEILNQHPRHFVTPQQEGVLPGMGADQGRLEWVPGKPGEAGKWVQTGEREYVGRETMQGSLFPTTERPESVWVPGEAAVAGRFEETGRVLEAGQVTAQPNLVNPRGNVPGGMRTGTQWGGMGEDVPMTTSYKEQRWVPGTEGKEGRYVDTGRTKEIPMEYGQGQLLPGEWVEKERWIDGIAPTPGRLDIVPANLTPEQLAALDAAPAPFAADPHLEWAGVIVESVKGTVYGGNQHLHDEVLQALAEGRAPDPVYLQGIADDAQPAKIIGAYEKPAAPERLNGAIFKKLNAVINFFAREPIFQGEYLQAMDEYAAAVGNGLTRDEAIQRSMTKATLRMLPHIDNAAERTLMSEHMRNWIPFYAAQQQAYARMGRLLAEDPAAFRRIQLAFTSMADFGGIYDDEAHNQHLIMPGSGLFTKGALSIADKLGVPVIGSIPSAFSGNLKSLTSVSPFLETGEIIKVGPLVSLGARALNNVLPESWNTRAVTDPIVGEIGASQQWWQMLVPNSTMRNVINATVASDNRTQAKSVLDAIQFLEFKQNVEMEKWEKAGKDPNDPDAPRYVPGPAATDMERYQFIDRVKNHARIIGLAKAAFGAASPLAPAAQIGDVGLKTELYDLIREKGISVAIQEFLEKNPDATPYAVFQTDAGTPSPIESTHPTQEWVRNNIKFITDRRFSAAASYFVPQTDDPFSQEVYNEQLAMGLRRTKSPDQLIKDIETGQGNRWYHDTYKPALDAALAKARSPHERDMVRTQFARKGGVDAQGNVIQSLDSMKMQNPIWYGNFSSGGKDVQRQLALAQMREAIVTGQAPETPQAAKIARLIEQFDKHQTAMLPGRTDGYASAMRKRETASWQSYLKTVVEQDPSLTMVVQSVFRSA